MSQICKWLRTQLSIAPNHSEDPCETVLRTPQRANNQTQASDIAHMQPDLSQQRLHTKETQMHIAQLQPDMSQEKLQRNETQIPLNNEHEGMEAALRCKTLENVALQKEIARLKQEIDLLRSTTTAQDLLQEEIFRLRQESAVMSAERDALRAENDARKASEVCLKCANQNRVDAVSVGSPAAEGSVSVEQSDTHSGLAPSREACEITPGRVRPERRPVSVRPHIFGGGNHVEGDNLGRTSDLRDICSK
jgi:septal ring factor EnvC (AmiA/AmiB activator)